MNSYEARLEARRERLEKASERATTEGEAKMGAGFRFFHEMNGQPILVGHHSEKRHRNAIAKADAKCRKGSELMKEGKELARRAEAVGTGGIASEDPDAVEKLTDKRTTLERQRDHMKQVNALYRKADKAGLAALGLDYDRLVAKVASIGLSWEKQPYAKWEISNLGARIRDAAKRTENVAALHAQFSDDGANDIKHEQVGAATITTDPSDMRVLVAFPARLSKEDYKTVRSHGFVWAPRRNAFSRRLTHPNVVEIARRMVAQLTPTP